MKKPLRLSFWPITRFFLTTFFILLLQVNAVLHAQNDTLEKGIASLNRTGCVITDSAIKIIGTGYIHSNKAFSGQETTLDEIDLNFRVSIDSLDPSGDVHFVIGKNSGLAGTMIEFIGTDSTSIINVNRLNGLTPTFAAQFMLPFFLELGENYNIRVGKRVRSLVIEIISTDSSAVFFNDSLSYPAPFFGCLWGTPFIACHTGTISVKDFSVTTPFSVSPRLFVWGDSFIEGNSLPSFYQRYVSLIQDSIGHQNIGIAGRGGEASTGLATRFFNELNWFSGSKYALVAVGVNDTDFTVWKTNMLIYLDTLKGRNIIPIIATLSPRADRLSFITQVNNWIRNVYNGAYIDVSKAVSSYGTSWMAGMALSDNIHPSAAGHLEIYERMLLEAPYLFRENDPYTIDFINETTNEPIGSFHEYSAFSNFSSFANGTMTSIPVVPGEYVFFRDTTDVSGVNSIYNILAVPHRPAAPTSPFVGGGAFDWINNPSFVNVYDYEFSNDAGATWTACVSKPIISIGSTSILVRVKATSSHFKGNTLIINDLITGIASAEQSADVLLFPNPVVDRLTIKNIFEETELTVYAADGRVVKTMLLENETNEINTEELNNGFYIFSLRNKSRQMTFRVLKK